MRILIVNTFYYPNIVGGAENVVQLLAEKLYNSNNEVAIFSIDSFSNRMTIEEINGVKVYRGTGGKFNTKVRFTKKGTILQKLKNKFIELKNKGIEKEIDFILKDFKPDIVHTNNIQGISPIIWSTLERKKIPCVHTVHDYWIMNFKNTTINKKKWYIKLHQSFFKKYSKSVDYVTAPSTFVLDAVKSCQIFNNAHYKVVKNGTEIELNKTKEIITEKNKIIDNNIKFLFVGSLFENKGILNLLEAFKNVKNDNITLDICGKGKLKNIVLEREKKDSRIKYNGMLKKEEMEKKYKECDVLIVPSIWDEPFGLVVIEANKFGLPIIGSNKAGIAEILETMKSGELYKFDNIKELEEKIIFFTNRNNIKKYYDKILNNIDKFSINNQYNEFFKIYKEIVGRSK